MTLTNKDILYKLAEETAYSSKGHFKSADWLHVSLGVYVFVPLVTSLLTALFQLPDFWQRVAGFLGLFFSVIAMASIRSNNRARADNEIKRHMQLGNKYLDLYKEARLLIVEGDNITNDKVRALDSSVRQLDQETASCQIGFAGRWWSKLRIKEEMELGWLEDHD